MAHILVVDDEEGLRAYAAEVLEDDGHTVVCAADGDAALDALRQQAFHLVITDLRMPGTDGLEVVRAGRALAPDAEFIVLTAWGSVDAAVTAMRDGAADFLQKPIESPAELRRVARRALERRELSARREQASRDAGAATLTWGAPSMAPIVDALRRVAATEATVLLTGESGTGKEVAALAIHAASARRDGPFVAVNCASLTDAMLESELFGHEKGAFTGAVARRRGRLELADGGTFFLDELAELRPNLQARLLRVLQEQRFERLGGAQTVAVDVRIIAATNRDLAAAVADGSFRDDLYHRLAVFPLHLPPLRERREDIPHLAAALLDRAGARVGRPGLRLTDDAVAMLCAARWPGNARELGNVLERAAILCDATVIDQAALRRAGLGDAAPGGADDDLTLAELEYRAITRALERNAGNRRQAAEALGIGVRTLYDRLKRYEDEGLL